jgi:hypothetical protein
MNTVRLLLPREWWRFSALAVAQVPIVIQLARHGQEDPILRTLGIIVLSMTPFALLAALKRVVLDLSWSGDRIEVRRGKRSLLACSWTEGTVVTEDLRNFLIYPPKKGAAVPLPKSQVPPDLEALLTRRLRKGNG